MNLIDTSTTSPHYFYWKCIGITNENLNFDIRVYRVKQQWQWQQQGQQKAISLNNETAKFVQFIAAHFLVDFSAVVAWLQCEYF